MATPLPGTSSTGNTTGMPTVRKPLARQQSNKNKNPSDQNGQYGPKPDPRAIMTAHGWVDPPYTAAEKAAAAKKSKPSNTVTTKDKGTKSKWDKYFKGGPTDPSTGNTFDPLAGMPGQTELSPFPTFDYNSIPDGSDVPDAPAHPFQSNKASLLDPNKYADMVGRKSYQPIIDAITQRVGGLQGGVGDVNSMLDKSFGSAATEAQTGAQRILDGTAKSNLGLTDLAARMAQTAGGDPLAAAAVGQATADQQGADSAQARVAAQAQSDQAAAAQRDLGTAKLGYKSATDTAISDLISKRAAATTEGNQASGKAIMDALGFNSDQKTAQQGRDTAAQEAWLAGQLAAPQITAGKLANVGTRAALVTGKHNTAVSDWSSKTNAEQTQITNRVAKWTNANVAKQMKMELAKGGQPKAEMALADPDAYKLSRDEIIGSSIDSKGNPLVDPGKIYQTALTRMKATYGDSQPLAVKKLALLFATEQLNAWNSAHSAGQAKSGKTWKIVKGAPALVKA